MTSGKFIVVVGSLNMELVMRVPRVPAAGDTLTEHKFSVMPGGKGANQAVVCARLGSRVLMAGRAGDDAFGRDLREAVVADGGDSEFVSTDDSAATGVEQAARLGQKAAAFSVARHDAQRSIPFRADL